jgi:hypothetical protein
LQDAEWTNNSQILIDLKNKVNQHRDAIKSVLGCSMREDYSPVAIAQKLLRDCLGLEFSDPVKKGSRGNQVRHYQPVAIPELREKIFKVWLERDEVAKAAKAAKAATEQTVVEQTILEQPTEPSVAGQTVEQPTEQPIEQSVAACESVPAQVSSGEESAQSEAIGSDLVGSDPVDQLISLFASCESEEDFREISKFAPECESVIEKEELIEAAILFSPLEIKSKFQHWWNSALWEVRDFGNL